MVIELLTYQFQSWSSYAYAGIPGGSGHHVIQKWKRNILPIYGPSEM